MLLNNFRRIVNGVVMESTATDSKFSKVNSEAVFDDINEVDNKVVEEIKAFDDEMSFISGNVSD